MASYLSASVTSSLLYLMLATILPALQLYSITTQDFNKQSSLLVLNLKSVLLGYLTPYIYLRSKKGLDKRPGKLSGQTAGVRRARRRECVTGARLINKINRVQLEIITCDKVYWGNLVISITV